MERLWAPWRMKYIKGLDKDDNGCFLCRCRDEVQRDGENFVLWRTEHSMAVFNMFPYNNGHLLIAPNRHAADLSELTDAEEHRQRFTKWCEIRKGNGCSEYVPDPAFLQALERGIPESAGCALGLDRLLMIINDSDCV